MAEDKVPQTVEEILADFSGDKHGAAKYLSMRDGISAGEARNRIANADEEKVQQLITQKRIDELSHCPECGGDQITVSKETHVESQSRSFIWNLFMTIITAGIWLIWMLVRGKKEEIVETKTAVCQKCGHSWELYY